MLLSPYIAPLIIPSLSSSSLLSVFFYKNWSLERLLNIEHPVASSFDSIVSNKCPKMIVFTLDRFKIGSRGEICAIEPLELRFPLETVFSWMEYLVRAGWTPDGNL